MFVITFSHKLKLLATMHSIQRRGNQIEPRYGARSAATALTVLCVLCVQRLQRAYVKSKCYMWANQTDQP